MAVTKIKCRTSGTDKAIQYILNGDKTQGEILTARLNCDPGYEYRQMKDTKEYFNKTDGRQCYHIIISYKPGEITPKLALQIAEEFARENLSDYEVVMAVHTDKHHIHSHIVFKATKLNTEIGCRSACADRSDFCVRDGRIRCSRRKGYSRRFRAIWML